jgi:23S rRNA pseudouridine2457 synthase
LNRSDQRIRNTTNPNQLRDQSLRDQSFNARKDCLYLAFFKPYDVITQFSPPEGQQQTLANFGFPPNVYPIGRLDSDSEGLLVLSDDSRLNNALLNPEYGHERTYWAQVDNIPSESALEQIRRGVIVQGRKTKPCRAELLKDEPNLPPRTVPIRVRKNIPTSWISLTLTEGKNRQVRRMTAAIGHPTLRLVRWSIGALTLAQLDLKPGEWKQLSSQEVKSLFA